jgi:hypothetical protein
MEGVVLELEEKSAFNSNFFWGGISDQSSVFNNAGGIFAT